MSKKQSRILPRRLQVGDEIMETCMGRVLRIYIVESIEENNAVATTKNGLTINCNTEISQDGKISAEGGICISSEFKFLSELLRKKFDLSKVLNAIQINLNSVSELISNTSLDAEKADIVEIKDIEKEFCNLGVKLSKIYEKYGKQ